MHKVSILVAVYNSEQYLTQCLESLLNQTYTNLQIICVDDASTDDSKTILDTFSKNDARIIVAHNETNQGQAITRNHALEFADGDFVTMVDSDDWLAQDAIESALKVFDQDSNTDSVLFELVYFNESNNAFELYPAYAPQLSFNGEEALKATLDWSLHGLYVTRMSIQKQFPYDESVRFGGDDNTTRMHFLKSRFVRRCSGKYYYRRHSKSVTGHIASYRFDTLVASASMKRHLADMGVSKDLRDIFEHIFWHDTVNMYDYFLKYKSQFSPIERAEILNKIHDAWKCVDKRSLPLSEKAKGVFLNVTFFPTFKMWVAAYRWLRAHTPSVFLKTRLKY